MNKINYVITTWAGERRSPNSNYLKDHLLKLSTLKHNLTQITIVKPTVCDDKFGYYDIENMISLFDCDVVVLEKNDNLGQSYGQFIFAYEKYKNLFDFYIFVEDDYMADIDNFDEILYNLYCDKKVEGFLCSYSGYHPEYPKGACSVSNGFISSSFLERIYDFFPNPIIQINGREGHHCHYNFVKMLRDCDFEFKDFSKEYRVPYYGDNIIEYGRTDCDQSIFVPHQILDFKINLRQMELSDIENFLKIRNSSREFLHNDSLFTLSESKKWFVDSKPIFFILQLNNKIIGYFRTSNWTEDSLYVGCDIDPNYRNMGLGFLSYLEFIKFLKNKFNIKCLKLEVLSINNRAMHLYEKLGFKKIGISEEKIQRNDQEIESIIMELNL
jgi:RimJ/RimL family protein N-acetyltransferase